MIDDRCRCNGLASARWTLYETERLLQDSFDSCHLGVIELRKIRRREALRHLSSEDLRLELMTQEFVVLYIP